MYQIHCLKANNTVMKDTFNKYLCKKQYEDLKECKIYAEKLSTAYPTCIFSLEFERKDMSYKDYIMQEFSK